MSIVRSTDSVQGVGRIAERIVRLRAEEAEADERDDRDERDDEGVLDEALAAIVAEKRANDYRRRSRSPL